MQAFWSKRRVAVILLGGVGALILAASLPACVYRHDRPMILGPRDSCTSEVSKVECQAGLSLLYSDVSGGLPAAEQALDALFGRRQVIQLTSAVIAHGSTLVRRSRTGIWLRTLDALHVATCAEVQQQLGTRSVEYLTADRRQHNGLTVEGFTGVLLA